VLGAWRRRASTHGLDRFDIMRTSGLQILWNLEFVSDSPCGRKCHSVLMESALLFYSLVVDEGDIPAQILLSSLLWD